MSEYRKYDVEVSDYKDSKKFHITNNYFDKSDYAFYKNGAITSYSDNAANFVKRCLEKVEGFLDKAKSGRCYAIYTDGVHGEALKYERVPGKNKIYTSSQHKETVYLKNAVEENSKIQIQGVKQLDYIQNVDLRDALREIAKQNTYFHLENDLGISIEQMERAAKINDYSDKTLIWVSYPAGIDCYTEREIFQKDTRGYNGVLYHGGGAEHEIKCAYAVDVRGITDNRVRGSLYEIDIREYADNVRKNAVASNSIRIYVDDPHGNGEQIVMAKAEFDRRYPLDLVKMAYWRNEPKNPEELKAVLDNVWNTERGSDYKATDIMYHTSKLYDTRYNFHADKLVEALNKHPTPNSPDKQSFTTPLDGRIAFALSPEQLGRLLDTLPYKNAVFTVQRGALNMNLVVPKDEVLQARGEQAKDKSVKTDKSEKPSLLADLEAGDKKSKEQFGGQKAEPGKDTHKKSKGEEI